MSLFMSYNPLHPAGIQGGGAKDEPVYEEFPESNWLNQGDLSADLVCSFNSLVCRREFVSKTCEKDSYTVLKLNNSNINTQRI